MVWLDKIEFIYVEIKARIDIEYVSDMKLRLIVNLTVQWWELIEAILDVNICKH